MASLCDFVNNDGTVSRDQAKAAITASDEGRLDQESALAVVSAHNNDQVVNACVGGGGVSPATIAIGVLGLGAVAVALSQSDD